MQKPNFVVYTDGASRGNPGLAAAGFVIQSPDGEIWVKGYKYLGIATNNAAEYNAVILALERLKQDFGKHFPALIEIRVDSLLVCEQLSGRYKIKNKNLIVLAERVKNLQQEAGEVYFEHIPRAKNILADRLANQALDQRE